MTAVGELAEKIIQVARGIGADLAVIGVPPRSTLSRLLLGSVTQRVLERASCPALRMSSKLTRYAQLIRKAILGMRASRRRDGGGRLHRSQPRGDKWLWLVEAHKARR